MKIFKKIMQVCLRKIIKLFDYFSPRKYMKLYNWYLNHIGIDITGIPRYIHPSVAFEGKGYNKTHLGNNVVISRNVLLLVHDYSVTCGLRAIDEKIRYESFWLKDITIKDNVFIGANSTILPGTIIEENCIIGAGTVIKGKIPKNSVVIGNPSRIVSNTLEWAEKKQMEKEYIYEKKEFN